MPNQDAFKYRNYGYGCVMAVADGVGSDRYSHFGSKAVVQAVHEAFCAYVRGDISRTQITKSIYRHYVSILKTRYQSAASTTCLFAAYIFNQGLYLGLIGDGIICGSINSQPFVMQKKPTLLRTSLSRFHRKDQTPFGLRNSFQRIGSILYI